MGVHDQVRTMIAEVSAQERRVDILVNNAAAVHLDARDVNIVDADLDVWDEALRVNLNGPMYASRYIVPHMLGHGGGAIVMVSSLSHRLASGNRPAYDVTKAGLNALARSIAVGFGKQGVRCNVVAPGLTLSPSVLEQIPAKMREIYAGHTFSPAIGQPRDQAAAILFLASDEAAYINGAVLEVDGGLGAHVPVVPQLARLSCPA
jgi:NAD(P)-dependent dehydrogenase (short-subunit alcohol dehydrogenase family)